MANREPDKPTLRVITGGITDGLRKLPLPMTPEEEDGTAFDRESRDILSRIERAHEAMKQEEAER